MLLRLQNGNTKFHKILNNKVWSSNWNSEILEAIQYVCIKSEIEFYYTDFCLVINYIVI